MGNFYAMPKASYRSVSEELEERAIKMLDERGLFLLVSNHNPPGIYAKQANISNDPQQINNGNPAVHAHGEH